MSESSGLPSVEEVARVLFDSHYAGRDEVDRDLIWRLMNRETSEWFPKARAVLALFAAAVPRIQAENEALIERGWADAKVIADLRAQLASGRGEAPDSHPGPHAPSVQTCDHSVPRIKSPAGVV